MLALAIGLASGAACSGHASGRLAAPAGALGGRAGAGGRLARTSAHRDRRGGLARRSGEGRGGADRARRSRARQARQRARLLVGDARAPALRAAGARAPGRRAAIRRCAIPGSSSAGSCRSNGCGSSARFPSRPRRRGRMARFDGRANGRARGPREVTWPIEREHWSDEVAVPVLVTRCPLAPASPAAAASGPTRIELGARRRRGDRARDPDRRRAAAGAPGDGAAVAAGGGAGDGAWARRPPRSPRWPGSMRPAAHATSARAPRADRRDLHRCAGGDRRSGGRARAGDRKIAGGVPLDLPAMVRRSLALLLADRLDAAKRPDDAVAILGAPPHGDDDVGRYIAFRQVEAHARAGRRAELFAEAREALHRHGRADVDADPALGAIMDMALRTLEASPVSAETMEMLEALGPPRERLSRAQAFAEMALGAGAHASAMATFAWLYDNDTDAERRLQHLARESRGGGPRRRPGRVRPDLPAARRSGGARRAPLARQGAPSGRESERERRKANGKATGKANDARRRPPRPGNGGLIASAEAEGHTDQAARGALVRLAARAAGRGARRAAGAGRQRRSGRSGDAGRDAQAAPRRGGARSRRRGADHALPRRQRPPQVGAARLRRDGRVGAAPDPARRHPDWPQL